MALTDTFHPTRAAFDVLTEREKQRAKWGDKHDDDHDSGELSEAAGFLACGVLDATTPEWAVVLSDKHIADRRQRLVIAAALLLAEIERLDRQTQRDTVPVKGEE